MRMPRARWAETRGSRGGQPSARARRGRGGVRACVEKPALSCAASREESGTRRGPARRSRWVRGGPGTGRDDLPRSLGGCGARSPAVTAAGACRGRGRGGPTLGPWSEVGRGGWPRHGGLGPGPSACHCPSPPRTPASRDTHPGGRTGAPYQPPSACWLARERRRSEGTVSVSPLPWAAFCLWGRKTSSGLEIATESLITFCHRGLAAAPFTCPLLASG